MAATSGATCVVIVAGNPPRVATQGNAPVRLPKAKVRSRAAAVPPQPMLLKLRITRY